MGDNNFLRFTEHSERFTVFKTVLNGMFRPNIWFLAFALIFLTIDLSAQFPGSSRNPTGGRNPSGGFGGGSSRPSQRDPARDTLSKEVLYYYADNAEDKKLFKDSSFINFHLYDPIRQGEYEYVNLGNLGSAHRQLVYQQRFHRGFDAGFHNYDLYLTKPEDVRFYQLEKAFSDISFSQTSQEKTAFNGDFSKPIGKRTFLNVRYRNIRNEGQYNNQAARTNSFAPSISYQSKNQKYRGYLSIIANTVEQKENKGLSFDAGTISNVSKGLVAVGRPINTSTGESRYFSSDINYTQFYILEKIPKMNSPKEDIQGDSLRNLVTNIPPSKEDATEIELDTLPIGDSTKIKEVSIQREDSTEVIKETLLSDTKPIDKTTEKPKPAGKNSKGSRSPKRGEQPYPNQQQAPPNEPIAMIKPTGRKYTLKHNLSIRKNTYKFTDTDTSAYQPNFRTDGRGVRSFIQTNQVENTFSIRTFKLEKEQVSAFARNKTTNPKQKDLVEVGLTHTFTKLRQEGAADSTINNLFLFGNIQFTPSDRLKINTYGHLGVGQQVGDYYAKGDFLWNTKKLGRLNLSITQQLRTPSLVQRQFYVTQNNVWYNTFMDDNDPDTFKKIFENTLSASYTIPKVNISLTANYHLIKNYTYFDTLAQPQQLTNDLNIFQLKVENQIDVWRFHLQNTVYFQTNFEDEVDAIRFPKIYSIHRLYLDLKLFKVMESQFGGEIRINTPWRPNNFSPLTGQFHLQDNFQRTALNEDRTAFVATPIDEIPLYPFVDVFYNFRIKDFRFFLVAENVLHFLPVYTNFHYTTYPYPVADFQMRFGFRWLFLD